MIRSGWRRLVLAAVFAVVAGVTTQAVIFIGTGDPTHNTTAPTGELADSGWQWQGRWNGLMATAIAPDFFLTAGHVGGATGQLFHFGGRSYVAVASYLSPDSDLRLWRVAGTLPGFAPRYTGTVEVEQGVVVFGAGTQRGAPVVEHDQIKGWLWGPGDGVLRWGTNTVSQVVDATGQPRSAADLQPGDLLACAFDAGAGGDEVTLSGGDSGGGMFLQEAGIWKLAAVNVAVEASFRTTAGGGEFTAALFDRGGFYEEVAVGQWEPNEELPENLPAAFFAVRVAGNERWIERVLAGQVPPERAVTVEASPTLDGPFASELAARLDAPNARFFVPMTGDARFYRLRSDTALRVSYFTPMGDGIFLGFAP